MTKKLVVVIVGHSGAGKSTLSRLLGEYFRCPVLSFSYAGMELARVERDSTRFKQINGYIYNNIICTITNEKMIIVDGLASDEILSFLAGQFYVEVLFVNTPYSARIERIMSREGLSKGAAVMLEKKKSIGKEKSGLSLVINKAARAFDGTLPQDKLLFQVSSYLNSKYINS